MKLLLELGKTTLQKIIYISCQMETLATDLALLQTRYTIQRVVCLDQFHGTQHQEIMVVLIPH